MFKLKAKFKPAGDQPEAIKKLIKGVDKGFRYQTLLGVTGSGKTFTVANVIEKINKPTLVIAPNKTLAAQLYREYKDFFPENKVCYFVSYYDYYQPEAYLPVSDTYIQKEAMINDEIDRLRHEATSALLSRKDVIIVASVSCIYNLGVPGKYLETSIKIEKGKPITRGDLIRQFIRIYFERNNIAVLKRGQFRVRGDVFEFMPASEDVIYRIILDGQKTGKIAKVDPITRKEIGELEELAIFPSKHFITPVPERERAVSDIKKELRERLAYFKKNNLYLEIERLEKRTREDLEMIRRVGYCHGIENYSRHLSGKLAGEAPDTLLAYFGQPDEFLTVIDESHLAVPQIRGMFEGDRSRKQILAEHGWRLPSALDNRPLNFKEFQARIGQVIFTSATPAEFEAKNSEQVIEQIIRPTGLIDPEIYVRPVYNEKTNYSQIDDVVKEIEKTAAKKGRVMVTTLTKKMSEELSDYFAKKKIKSRYMHSDIKTLERADILMDFRKGEFDVLVGINLLREGLDLPEVELVAILDADSMGFLRNQTSLIQTIGRAARNSKARVILYADRMTDALKAAVSETERRRKIQIAYNKKHKITPKTIIKDVQRFIDVGS
ncbi:MAG: excinuclease ABC subunit UvrB [Candidatus Pacebacteria bacterium]|nr:excinuclease ABC subunit UvrB [Candidatus Paceibacterota bacterium]